ncbi:MAG: hypothetical protein QOG63_1744 [Thermoleophilaceae bacterium]|nr:hypothetical protein [Thermoleophilaceae bacterium]
MQRQEATRPLPRGPHNLTRDHVLASQRERMIEAVATVVADKGYGSTTVGDVVAGAGVSRKTFYEHFRDKEDCFLAAFDAGVDDLLAAIVAAEPDGPGWRSALRARVRAYLSMLAAHPDFAHAFLIEVFTAGPRALERRGQVHGRFEQLLADLYDQHEPKPPKLRPETWTAAVGALNEVVVGHLRRRGARDLVTLEDALVEIQTALFAGPRGDD